MWVHETNDLFEKCIKTIAVFKEMIPYFFSKICAVVAIPISPLFFNSIFQRG